MIPGQFDYVRPANLDEALRILKDREGEAKLLSGGYSLIPLIKLRLAQPALLVDLRDIDGLDAHRRDRRRPAHRRPGDPPADPRERDRPRPLPDARGRDRPHRRPAGPQLGHDRRLGRPRRPGVGLAGHPHRRRTPRSSAGAADRRAVDRGPGLLPRHLHDGHRADRGPDRDPHPAPAARTPAAAYEKLERKVGDFATAGVAVDRPARAPTAASRAPASASPAWPRRPFAATDAEAILVGERPGRRPLPPGRRRGRRRRADPAATSAVRSTTSGRWSPS